MPRPPGVCSIFATAFAVTVLAAAALAGCGSGGGPGNGDSPPPSPTASPSAGATAVLVVVPDTDFQQVEYDWVRTALTDAGFLVVCADASGDPARSGDVAVPVDLKIADAQAGDYAGVVLIGGPGAASLFDDAQLQTLVRDAAADDEVVAAICLAPVVLARAGVLEGKEGTVWPDERAELEDSGCSVQDKPVVVDGRIITGNGPDAAEEFSAAVVKALQSD